MAKRSGRGGKPAGKPNDELDDEPKPVRLRRIDAPHYFPPPPPERDSNRVSSYRDVMYAVHPGYRPLLLDLIRPRTSRKSLPVVAWLHGGAWRGGTHTRPSDAVDALLDAGIAVARVQYRLSGEVCFPGQLHDVKAALRWLRHFADQLGIDRRRVGVWGQSSGAHLALLAALTPNDRSLDPGFGPPSASTKVQAAVAWYPPTNLLSIRSQALPESPLDHDSADSAESRLLGHPVQERPDEARSASPVTYVTAQAPPVLLVHGTEDRVVPVGQSRELAAAMEAAGAPVELVEVDGADHGFDGADRESLVKLSVAFLCGVLPVDPPGPAETPHQPDVAD